jgi:hypothetical protein
MNIASCLSRRRVSFALVALWGGLAAAAPARVGASALHLVARADRGPGFAFALMADSSRYYTYLKEPDQVFSVDDVRHRSLQVPVPSGCRPRDVRFGLLLLDCSGASFPRVVQLGTGTSSEIRDADSSGAPEPDDLFAIGRDWLGGVSCGIGPSDCSQVYLNRSTLKRVVVSLSQDHDPAILLRDIDTLGLSPLRSPGRFSARIGRYTVRDQPGPNGFELALLREGGKLRVLSRCQNRCTSVSFGAGVVSWAEGPLAKAYLVRSRTKLTWRPPLAPAGSAALSVVHTSRSLLIETEQAGMGSQGTNAVYRARLPVKG